jgi:hypothetical protein
MFAALISDIWNLPVIGSLQIAFNSFAVKQESKLLSILGMKFTRARLFPKDFFL